MFTQIPVENIRSHEDGSDFQFQFAVNIEQPIEQNVPHSLVDVLLDLERVIHGNVLLMSLSQKVNYITHVFFQRISLFSFRF